MLQKYATFLNASLFFSVTVLDNTLVKVNLIYKLYI